MNAENFIRYDAQTAAVVAQELINMAQECEQFYFGPDQGTPFTSGAAHRWGALQAAKALRKRAGVILSTTEDDR